MNFWIPILLFEVFIIWLLAREKDGLDSDRKQSRAFATLFFIVVFAAIDAIVLGVRMLR
jgi:hypothetical protein